jgi:small subunit ribosomal protein S4
MGHYTGPKGRINRRLGAMIFEDHGAVKALERRGFPPGMQTGRRGKQSNYGIGLNEKQKIKYYYGLGERQLRKYFERASRVHGNTGEELLILCERRLDNVVRRAGFTFTRPQARQGIVHCHFDVNGVKTNKPSFLVRPGDVISVRPRQNLHKIYRELVEARGGESPSWIELEPDNLRAIVRGYPTAEDLSLPVEVALVIEFMSR